jgi:hypothetical protein
MARRKELVMAPQSPPRRLEKFQLLIVAAVLVATAGTHRPFACRANPVGEENNAAQTKRKRTDWFKNAQWGVFTHYLTSKETTSEEWNQRVAKFDVEVLASQLNSVGARYYVITLGQNSGHYCAPNRTYDEYVGIQPSKCSRRDLVADLYEALHPQGIKLMVYLPAGAPDQDPVAMKALQWKRGPYRNREFQTSWEKVIQEWSRRWGTKVVGWWFDGCYWPNAMYRTCEPPNFASFAQAARAGNPESIVTFNPGVTYPIISISEQEDYTAGEIDEPDRVSCGGRWVDGTQFHMLSYLGKWWSAPPRRFSDQQVIEWTKRIIEKQGVVTWDVPIQANGLIPQPFVDQLTNLRNALTR